MSITAHHVTSVVASFFFKPRLCEFQQTATLLPPSTLTCKCRHNEDLVNGPMRAQWFYRLMMFPIINVTPSCDRSPMTLHTVQVS